MNSAACKTCPFRTSRHAVAIHRDGAEAIALALDDQMFRFVCHSDSRSRRTCCGSEVFRVGAPKRGYLVTLRQLVKAQSGPRGPTYHLWGHPVDVAAELAENGLAVGDTCK